MSEEMISIQNEIIKQQELVIKIADEYIRTLTEMNELLSEKVQRLEKIEASEARGRAR